MLFASSDNKANSQRQLVPNTTLSGRNSRKPQSKSNKENLHPYKPKAEAKGKKCWFAEESPQRGNSKDSLFVDSDTEPPKFDFLKLGHADFDLRNVPLKTLFNVSDLSDEKSPDKSKAIPEKMTISKVSSKEASRHYLRNTHEFIKNCFESISNRRSESRSKEARADSREVAGGQMPDLRRLLRTYNKRVSGLLRRRICKRESRRRFRGRVIAFIKGNEDAKDALLRCFRQGVETLPQLLHIFKPETQPKLQQIQENISINQLSNLPRRNYQSKNLKSTIQLFCFKYYFFKMKKKPLKKNKYVAKLQRLTRMSGRQIYKWVWDEEKRFQELAKTCSIRDLHRREQSIYSSWRRIKESFRRKVKDRNLWIVSKIILKSVGFFSEKIEKKIWNVKLKGLLQKSIFMDLSF